MHLSEFEQDALQHSFFHRDEKIFGEMTPRLLVSALGLAGEAGEVTEKFKKLVRDHDGVLTDELRNDIVKELGDVLWYVTSLGHLVGSDLETIARVNVEKRHSRLARGTTHGSGDNR